MTPKVPGPPDERPSADRPSALGPRPVLLAIDAVVLQRLFTTDRKAWPLENEEQLRASTHKLLNLVEREHVTLVVFGHDGQQWQTLKKAPAFYE